MACQRRRKQEAVISTALDSILAVPKFPGRERFLELQQANPIWTYQQIGDFMYTGTEGWAPSVYYQSFQETPGGKHWTCRAQVEGVHFYLEASSKGSEVTGTIYYAFTGMGLWTALPESIRQTMLNSTA